MISVHLGIEEIKMTYINELNQPLAIRNDEVSGSIPLSSTKFFHLWFFGHGARGLAYSTFFPVRQCPPIGCRCQVNKIPKFNYT